MCVYSARQIRDKYRKLKCAYYDTLAHNQKNPGQEKYMDFMDEMEALVNQRPTSLQSHQSDMTKTSQPVTQSQDRHAASSPRTEESNGGPATPAADTEPPTDRPAESEPQPGHTPGAARSDLTQGQRIARFVNVFFPLSCFTTFNSISETCYHFFILFSI